MTTFWFVVKCVCVFFVIDVAVVVLLATLAWRRSQPKMPKAGYR